MKLVEPDVITKSVAPFYDASENSKFVDINVGVLTYVSADRRRWGALWST